VSFIITYIDLELKVRPDDSAVTLAAAEIERINKLFNIAKAAQTIPRRLGTEASSLELMIDKQRARRVEHTAKQLLRDWKAQPAELEVVREAAVVDWMRWWADHRVFLINRQAYIATWCHKYGDDNGDIRWCKSAIVRLNNEVKWLTYALR
jgi:hypothetical protein